jgi:dTMP kinase
MNNKLSRGQFITIEGIEGVGKTTSSKFLLNYLQEQKLPVVTTREPGGTTIAEEIRDILLKPHAETMCFETELLLVFASRAQHLVQVIQPALQRGDWVLCDRFTDATYAYQGGGRGMSEKRIALLEEWVLAGFGPDLTILLHAPETVALTRAKNRSSTSDRFETETENFFKRVQDVYMKRAQDFPERYRLVNANQPLEAVQAQLKKIVDEFLSACNK